MLRVGNSRRILSRAFSGAGGGGAPDILRYVTTNNYVNAQSASATTIRGFAGKDIAYIGSGDVEYLHIQILPWALGGFVTTSPMQIQQVWISVAGQSTGFRVLFGGNPTATVPAGVTEFLSDRILPSDLGFSGGVITRGTKLYIGRAIEVDVGALYPIAGTDRNAEQTNSSIRYTPGVTNLICLNNVTTTFTNTGGGEESTGGSSQPIPANVIGKFANNIVIQEGALPCNLSRACLASWDILPLSGASCVKMYKLCRGYPFFSRNCQR
jgi:hypothetical protein